MSLKELRENKWSVRQLVNWLINSHMHFIVAHPHQGTDNFGWACEDLYDELQRLRYHPGFPRLDQLRCPVFTQDKFAYYEALPDGIMLPTFKIPLSRDTDKSTMEALLTR